MLYQGTKVNISLNSWLYLNTIMTEYPEIKNAAIYVARHGECEGNVSKELLDPFTDPLTEVGKAQAELLGAHLKSIPFTHAYSSDYLRAEQTAEIILRELDTPSSPINLLSDKRLRERDCTGMIGKSMPLAKSIVVDVDTGTHLTVDETPTCETVEQFESRVISFFSELLQLLTIQKCNDDYDRCSSPNILIISHGFAIQKLMYLLNSRHTDFGIHQWTIDRFSERLMKNASYHKVVLEISPQPCENDHSKCESVVKVCGRVEVAHCRDHLDFGGGI